ncbi:MAG: polysaccharide deacetylase family protein, partial [Bacilli bacterium]|nr:polysaccharide deacetylase family protein [Bacilli bacterium]
KKTKISKGKVVVRIMMAFLILILLFIGSFIVDNEVKKYQEKKILEEKETIVLSIKNHYNHYVKVINDTKLYHLNNQGEYIEYGKVYKDTEVILDDISIDYLTKYFYSSDLDGYLAYDDLLPIDEISSYDDRYKRYLVFNNNVVTNDEFTLYDEDKPVYTFLESMSFPIIIKDYENRYYVEYNNRLLAIKKEDVKEIINHDNTTGKNMKSITTLCYHRVYDTTEKCTDPYVCIKKASFDKEMKYLKDNGYLTLSMKELYWYLTGKIQVSKAVTITFDDGYLYKSAEDVLAKYDLNGTIFVISSYFDDIDTYKNLKHLDLQSHTHNMHRNYVCSGGTQGGAILCASEQTIKEDLEKSLAKLDVEPWGLAFPFYDHNDKAIKVVKEVGFKMSFIGRAGVMGKAYPNKTYLYKIPRMTVWDESIMNFNTWKSYL